jgi:polysaccharide biosynthesis/export protein
MEFAAFMQRDYTLRAGDKLSVRVEQLVTPGAAGADGTQEVIVSPTGTIDLRRLSAPVQVAGRSVGAVRTAILDAYKQEFENPRVSVTLLQTAVQSVYVCGEVKTPGAIVYQPGMTMSQAVAASGSFSYTVKESDIRVLRINPDGTQRTFRVNLSAVLRDEYPDFLLLPGDVVYCQTSTIADLGNLVDLYIRRLLPFSLSGPTVGSVRN